MSVLDDLRERCAEVARRANSVRINQAAVPAYAASLSPANPSADETPGASQQEKAAFWLTLDAINFGSGWFPTLRKRPGQSGYHTIATGLRERFERHGPWSPPELRSLTAAEIAAALSQDPEHELIELFARSLNDLGRHLEAEGGFLAAARGAATDVVERLATWDSFADSSTYDGLDIPFLKRAQIVAADLHRAGVSRYGDLDHLTMFADNLVPHVLRLDGILTFAPDLVERINHRALIEHGSREEVEIRACALHAVELIVARRLGATAAETDQLLWLRGQEPRYKAQPRHRSRCTAY